MAGMGWLGPLIDLSAAASHGGDFVQLLVVVHRSNPVQYKLAKGGTVIRADIHVGDDTRPFFCVSLWNKHLASSVSAGHIILLQNVKVIKFGNTVEARTVQYSSILRLIHPYDSLLSKGVDDLMGTCRVGGTAKEKLRRVIEWVQRTRSTLHNELKGNQRSALQNWKVHEERSLQSCSLLAEVLKLASPCKAIFHASVGEIFLPYPWHEGEKERMFISRQLDNRIDNLVEDMICTGCQLCGSPLCSDSRTELKTGPLYCNSSSNRLHTVGLIYRPFMLYVWDNSDYIPLLVTNKAAELLFGNIKAEKVYHSHKEQKAHQSLRSLFRAAANVHKSKIGKAEVTESCSLAGDARSEIKAKDNATEIPNFYLIWLILLKMLLLQEKNSPLKFEALVNPSMEMEDGRFEMICVSMPYFRCHVPFSET